jgi:flagellar biogenesis protein FliO
MPRAFQFSAAWAGGLVLLLAGMAAGAPGAATRPSRDPEGDAQANVWAAAPPAANRSPTDSQPIRRSGSDGAGGASAAKPPGMETPRVAGALAAVIALIFLLKWAGKKLLRQPGAGKTTRAVQVLARSAVSHRQQILLVMVGKRLLVVGDSGAQMNALSEITDPDEVAALVGQVQGDKPDLAARAFGAMFGRAKAGIEDAEEAEEVESPAAGVISRESQAIGANETTNANADGADAVDDHGETEEAVISDTREELNGLMERVRLMSRQLHKG